MSQEDAGQTKFDDSDRLAILNVVNAYAVRVDYYPLDDWFDLFTDDIEYVLQTPGGEQTPLQGKEAVRQFWEGMFANAEKQGNKLKVSISSITFVEESDSSAHVMTTGFLSTVNSGTFTLLTSLKYEGWLVKHDHIWKIKKWIDAPDVMAL